MKICVVDHTDQEHVLEAKEGKKVMEIIRDAGLPIEALCGGGCACSTYHVYIDLEWMGKVGGLGEEELDTLDLAFDVMEISHLPCQIPFTAELDGLRMKLGTE